MRTKVLISAGVLLLAGAARAQSPVPPIELVRVPAGCFQMGSEAGEKHEKPVHKVCVGSFEIGKLEVTQAQWQAVMGKNPAKFSSCGDACPVEQVSWNEAQEFVKRLNAQKQGVYRLPTEAEWEYACRSGGKDEVFPGGVAAAEVSQIAWHNKDEVGNMTHPVGTKKPNGLGLHDMSGNVWEWVHDAFVTPYDVSAGENNPRVEKSVEQKRVIRGGSWNQKVNYVRCGIRARYEPDFRDSRIGLRVVKEAAK
jgi:formylglycine-generating enzyme required for sulfatase activity